MITWKTSSAYHVNEVTITASKGQQLLGRMAARAATAHAPRIPLRSLGPDSISDLTLRFRLPSGGLWWTSFELGSGEPTCEVT